MSEKVKPRYGCKLVALISWPSPVRFRLYRTLNLHNQEYSGIIGHFDEAVIHRMTVFRPSHTILHRESRILAHSGSEGWSDGPYGPPWTVSLPRTY